jgi:hypothetical protein
MFEERFGLLSGVHSFTPGMQPGPASSCIAVISINFRILAG